MRRILTKRGVIMQKTIVQTGIRGIEGVVLIEPGDGGTVYVRGIEDFALVTPGGGGTGV